MEMREFTWRAILLGLAMTIVLGAANAYLGLRAESPSQQPIRSSDCHGGDAGLEGIAPGREHRPNCRFDRRSIAAGAIFTVPAFLIAKACLRFVRLMRTGSPPR